MHLIISNSSHVFGTAEPSVFDPDSDNTDEDDFELAARQRAAKRARTGTDLSWYMRLCPIYVAASKSYYSIIFIFMLYFLCSNVTYEYTYSVPYINMIDQVWNPGPQWYT